MHIFILIDILLQIIYIYTYLENKIIQKELGKKIYKLISRFFLKIANLAYLRQDLTNLFHVF